MLIETLMVVGGAVLTGHEIYGLYHTCQSVLFGKDAVQRQIENAVQKQVDLQMQQVTNKFLYAANLDAVHLRKPPANLPPAPLPSTEALEKFIAPTQALAAGLNQNKPQPALGSSLIHLPSYFNINKVINACALHYFLDDDPEEDWPPPEPNEIWVLFPIYDHRTGRDNYHIGLVRREDLAAQGLGIHQEWQPNRYILPPELRCEEATVRSVLGLKPLEPPKPQLELIHGWSTQQVQDLQQQTARALKLPVEFQHDLKFGGKGPAMLVIPAGIYLMGSPDEYEKPIHQVTISKPFAMGKYPVTNAEYRKFRPKHDSGKYQDLSLNDDTQPVVRVSWEDAMAYCTWLSEQTGKDYRLPTEAEWEYCCRAGTNTRYWWGDEIGKNNANCNGCGSQWDNKQTATVGSFKPNPWGLYDVHGNVWEWCNDWYAEDYYQQSPDHDPIGPRDGAARVLRGGSWHSNAGNVRAANRSRYEPGNQSTLVGFRACEVQVK